jgi:16S rRNA (uracil1498-N3)-methyltransferase
MLPHLQRLAIAPHQRVDQQIALTADQQHYLHRVLRLRSGDRFIALDGQSGWWLAELSREMAIAHCLNPIPVQNELPIPITLMIGMPKAGMDDVVRQATELGVASIRPIQSDRTVLKPSGQKVERWRRIAQEAAEQSERQVIPTIHDPQSWTDAIAQIDASTTIRWICLARDGTDSLLHQLTSRDLTPGTAIALAIGPEGGWTPAEAEQAIAAGFQPISLGSRILRAVTAPVAALAIIAAVLEDPIHPKAKALS